MKNSLGWQSKFGGASAKVGSRGKVDFDYNVRVPDPFNVITTLPAPERVRQKEAELDNLPETKRERAIQATHSERPWPVPPKGALVKANDVSDFLEFHFNPSEWGIPEIALWSSTQVPGWLRPLYQYGGGGEAVLELKLLFSDFFPGAQHLKTVEEAIEWFKNAARPIRARVEGAERTEPPSLLYFIWGKQRPQEQSQLSGSRGPFILDSVKPLREQFDWDLITIRATIDIVLKEYVEPPI